MVRLVRATIQTVKLYYHIIWVPFFLSRHFTHQLGPRHEGQLMSDGGAYSPFRSIHLVLTHGFIITCVYGPTDSDGHKRKDVDAALRTILCRLRQRECCMLGAPSSQPTVPIHELPPARLVIHRQTSAHERRKWMRSVQSRSGILKYLCIRQHWLWITVEFHISGYQYQFTPVTRPNYSSRHTIATTPAERISTISGIAVYM